MIQFGGSSRVSQWAFGLHCPLKETNPAESIRNITIPSHRSEPAQKSNDLSVEDCIAVSLIPEIPEPPFQCLNRFLIQNIATQDAESLQDERISTHAG